MSEEIQRVGCRGAAAKFRSALDPLVERGLIIIEDVGSHGEFDIIGGEQTISTLTEIFRNAGAVPLTVTEAGEA